MEGVSLEEERQRESEVRVIDATVCATCQSEILSHTIILVLAHASSWRMHERNLQLESSLFNSKKCVFSP